MANQFKTPVSGTFTVNGVEIGASSGEAQAALAQRAIRTCSERPTMPTASLAAASTPTFSRSVRRVPQT